MTTGNGQAPHRRRSTHPYRDSALAYALLGAVVVVIAYATGSSLLRSVIGGIAAFVLATGWTWWRMRTRAREQARAKR